MTNNILGERIRKMREKKGLSQLELANQINISRLSIGNYEKGDRTPDALLLKEMAIIFSCSTDYLLGLCDSTIPENMELMVNFGLSEESVLAMQSLYQYKNVLPNIDGSLMPFFNELIVEDDFIYFIKHIQILTSYFVPDCYDKNEYNLKFEYPAFLGGGEDCLTDNLLLDVEKTRMHHCVDLLLARLWKKRLDEIAKDIY